MHVCLQNCMHMSYTHTRTCLQDCMRVSHTHTHASRTACMSHTHTHASRTACVSYTRTHTCLQDCMHMSYTHASRTACVSHTHTSASSPAAAILHQGWTHSLVKVGGARTTSWPWLQACSRPLRWTQPLTLRPRVGPSTSLISVLPAWNGTKYGLQP